MEKITGESAQYLEIDLTKKTWNVFSPSQEDLREYIGGKGLGLKFIYNRLESASERSTPLGRRTYSPL